MKNIVFLILMSLPVMAAAQSAPAGNAETGKKLFMKQNCYYCHGATGQDGRDGARIAQTALNLQGVVRYVRKPTGGMPAFTEKILSDQELTDIYAYLKSCRPRRHRKIFLCSIKSNNGLADKKYKGRRTGRTAIRRSPQRYIICGGRSTSEMFPSSTCKIGFV